jgi:hypothetical protein
MGSVNIRLNFPDARVSRLPLSGSRQKEGAKRQRQTETGCGLDNLQIRFHYDILPNISGGLVPLQLDESVSRAQRLSEIVSVPVIAEAFITGTLTTSSDQAGALEKPVACGSFNEKKTVERGH